MIGKAFRLISARSAYIVVVAALLPTSWLGLAGLHGPPQPVPSRFRWHYPVSSRLSFVPDAGQTDPSARFVAPAVTGTPTPAGVVRGHVTWQGSTQPDPRQVQTATLSLCSYHNLVWASFTIMTDQSGNFSVVTDLPDDEYGWRLKGPRSLFNAGSLDISGGMTGVVEMNDTACNCQKAGDADGDNAVSAPDFVIMKNTYGLAEGEPGYDRRADFDNSNVASAPDFALLRANFGVTGPIVGCPLPR